MDLVIPKVAFYPSGEPDEKACLVSQVDSTRTVCGKKAPDGCDIKEAWVPTLLVDVKPDEACPKCFSAFSLVTPLAGVVKPKAEPEPQTLAEALSIPLINRLTNEES